MPFRRGGFFGRKRGFPRPKVSSEKNNINQFTAFATGAKQGITVAVAKNFADNLITNEVTRDCHIYKIWVEFWIYATADSAVGVTNGFDLYMMKNPGANLTTPTPGTVGSSNEKKFVFKMWKGLIGARTDGAYPYNWKGWIKVPKVYQRMGTDDLIQLVGVSTGVNAVFCHNIIYKWFK